MFSVEYAKSAAKDLKSLPKSLRARALNVAEDFLARNPYQGKPLAGPYKGLCRFRVGEFRIVYSIEKERIVVFVLRIRHRKDVYRGLV
ncbi:MAG: type II toxin-antitoxin system RelE/ParE family toxin [Acidobacteriota bacterium]|nr:MAG: type II toxin-antitoxin system RelE/ParE family toxin [Acidobacteriota bacterium]